MGAFIQTSLAESTFPIDPFNENHRFRIQGAAGARLITLDSCLKIGERVEIPGIFHEEYRVPVVLSGYHFDESEPLEFDSVTVSLRHLEHWVNRSGVSVEYIQEEGANRVRSVNIEHSPLESTVTQTHIGQLELSFGWKVLGDHILQSTIEQKCGFSLRFAEPLALEDILNHCSALKDIVTIGLDTPSQFIEVTLKLQLPDELRNNSGQSHAEIKLYADLKGPAYQTKKRAPQPAQMIFTFDDIGGLTGIGEWVGVAHRYRVVIGSLMNSIYSPELSEENRFFNAVVAAEALARIKVGKQQVNLGMELASLGHEAGETFKVLVGDIATWAKTIVRTRDNFVVHPGLHEYVNSPQMFFLGESLYLLVILSLLRECGIEESTLKNIGKHQRFKRIADKLREDN